MSKRSTKTANPPGKPKQPYQPFPLFAHNNGRWAKKILGKTVFFGRWDDWPAALRLFEQQRPYLFQGIPQKAIADHLRAERTRGGDAFSPPPAADGPPSPRAAAWVLPGGSGGAGARGATSGVSVRDLVNHFLTAKQRRLDAGDMGARSFSDYHATASSLVAKLGADRDVLGLMPSDFGRLRERLAKTYGPVRLGNEVVRIRSIFKHGYESKLLDQPMRFGPEFCKPPRRAIRLARRKRGARMFEPAEIKAILEAASPQLKAMVLLGLNCGMGNTDVAAMPRSAVDLKTCGDGWGVLDFPRPKTAISRRAVLWPETVEALKAILESRPKPKRHEDVGLVFITKYGSPWVRVQSPKEGGTAKAKAIVRDSVALEFGKLCRAAGVYVKDRGFYALRHTFRTVADELPDRRAIDLVMGHENGADISHHYVERIADARLRAVAEHVRLWCFPK